MNTIHPQPESDLTLFLRANRYRTRFALGPGRYFCATGWGFERDYRHVCLGPGCELIGAGSDQTTLVCVGETPKAALQIEGFTAGDRIGAYPSEVTTIRGIRFQPQNPTELGVGIIGLHVWASRCVLDDIEIIGISGVRPNREGFGLLVNGAGPAGWGGGSRISRIRVHSAGGYVCGVYVGYKHPTEPTVVHDVCVDGDAEIASHAAYGTNGGVLWSAIRNLGRWERGVFCDTSGGSGTVISGSHIKAERVLVEFRGTSSETWRDILVTGSILETIPTTEREYAAGLVLATDGDGPGAVFDGVRIENCILRPSPGKHFIGSVDSTRVNIQTCGVFGGLCPGWAPMVLSNRKP